jgi:hypothetical protein
MTTYICCKIGRNVNAEDCFHGRWEPNEPFTSAVRRLFKRFQFEKGDIIHVKDSEGSWKKIVFHHTFEDFVDVTRDNEGVRVERATYLSCKFEKNGQTHRRCGRWEQNETFTAAILHLFRPFQFESGDIIEVLDNEDNWKKIVYHNTFEDFDDVTRDDVGVIVQRR